ncbi:MAG TPA: hypothetical protein VFT72_08915 [Opitutaceae bacterium]|nr:hypothetical protein [Opitutaceae bacterium]
MITAAWIFFLPMILSSTLTKRTGFEVKVERLSMNPFAASVDLEGLSISNPHTFPRPDYVEVRSFQARAPFKTLFGDRPEFDYVKLDAPHVTFVRNTDGTLNANLFYDRLFPSEKPDSDEPTPEKRKPTASPKSPRSQPAAPRNTRFLIHHLELRVDKITWDDQYSRNPSTRNFDVHLYQVLEEVTDAKQLLTPAMMRAVAPVATAISGLIPGDLGQVFGAAAGGPMMREANKKAPDVASPEADTLEESRKP